MKTSKSKYTPKYKSDKKLNIYEPNSSSMKGFYNTNLNKEKNYMFQIIVKLLENTKHQILKKI